MVERAERGAAGRVITVMLIAVVILALGGVIAYLLSLYYEEELSENGGHQEVTSTFSPI